MAIDAKMPCIAFGKGKAVMKGTSIEGVPLMIVCELSPDVVVKTGDPVSAQQVKDSKNVLGMAFFNKESIDVVISWLDLMKENYDRLSGMGSKTDAEGGAE